MEVDKQNLINCRKIKVLSTCSRVKVIVSSRIEKTGTIYGVFSKAIYLKVDCSLITLTAENGNFPYGVILKSEDLSFIRRVNLQDTFFISNCSSIFPKQFISLDFSEAVAWIPGHFPSRLVDHQKVLDNLEVLKTYLENFSINEGLVDVARYIEPRRRAIAQNNLDDVSLNVFCQFALPILRSIKINWEIGFYEEAMLHAYKLVGLGPGLTPSGDDFLLGMMSSIYGGFNLCPFIKTQLKQALKLLAISENQITSEISRGLLYEASAGKVPEYLYNLTYSLFYSDIDDTSSCAKQLANIGATSGQDMIVGALFGGVLMMELISDK
jgi:hypothetical protein